MVRDKFLECFENVKFCEIWYSLGDYYSNFYFLDVFEKIKAGFENAKNYLQTARDIADLVSKSLKSKLNQNTKRGDQADFQQDNNQNGSFQPTNLISTFFRLLGLDSRKITAVAVNSFIFFAQMVYFRILILLFL